MTRLVNVLGRDAARKLVDAYLRVRVRKQKEWNNVPYEVSMECTDYVRAPVIRDHMRKALSKVLSRNKYTNFEVMRAMTVLDKLREEQAEIIKER